MGGGISKNGGVICTKIVFVTQVHKSKHSTLFYTHPLPRGSLSPNARQCQPCFQESIISDFIQRTSLLSLAQSAHLSEEHTLSVATNNSEMAEVGSAMLGVLKNTSCSF